MYCYLSSAYFYYITLHIKKSSIMINLDYLWDINAVLELSLNIYNIL